MSSPSLDALLAAHPVLIDLSAEDRAFLIEHSTELNLVDGDVLYASGAPADALFITVRGALQVELPTAPATRGRVSTVFLAPGILGECQLLNERPFSGTGVVVGALHGLAISRERFVALLERAPLFGRTLYYELTARFLRALETWRHDPEVDAEHLLARYLLARRHALAHAGVPNENVGLSQVDLARAAGIRAETANRILGAWEKQGLIARAVRSLHLADATALASHALGPGPPLLQRCELPPIVAPTSTAT